MSKTKELVLSHTPSGVCYNCLNRFHKGCQYKDCRCCKLKHDDSEWWVPVTKKSKP